MRQPARGTCRSRSRTARGRRACWGKDPRRAGCRAARQPQAPRRSRHAGRRRRLRGAAHRWARARSAGAVSAIVVDAFGGARPTSPRSIRGRGSAGRSASTSATTDARPSSSARRRPSRSAVHCSVTATRRTAYAPRTIRARTRRRSSRRPSPRSSLARRRRLRSDEEPADAHRRAAQAERAMGHEPRAAHARDRRDGSSPLDTGRREARARGSRRGRLPVTFDNVARRVTRLKLFTVLAAVREMRSQKSLDPDEPVFKDPNALLRRLVRDGTLTEDELPRSVGRHDPVRALERPAAGAVPRTIHGFDLRAPGPMDWSAPPTTCAIRSSVSCARGARMRERCRRTRSSMPSGT